jgi:hypothetical protein
VYSAGMNMKEGAFVQDVTCQRDPCLMQKGSISRFAVLTLLFFTMLAGIGFLILFANRPYGIQVSSIVIDTAAVALYTFSRNRNNMQPFQLSCPVVRRQIPLLIRRHVGFLAALLLVQTTALEFRPNLPEYLITPRGTDPSLFAVILGVLCGCLAVAQIPQQSFAPRTRPPFGASELSLIVGEKNTISLTRRRLDCGTSDKC